MTLVVALIAAHSLVCDPQGKVAEAREAAGGSRAASPPPSPAEFGAAAWIPEDAAYFSSTLRLRDRWRAVKESRAFRKCLNLPVIQIALVQLRMHPAYREFLVQAERNPLVRSALEVAADAVSSEVFLYSGAQLVPFLHAVGDLYLTVFLEGLRAGAVGNPRPLPLPILIKAMLQHEKALRVPPVIIGFRLSRPEAARSLLEHVVAMVWSSLPSPLAVEEAGGGRFHTLRLSFQRVPPALRQRFTTHLLLNGLEEDLVARFSAFLNSQTLALSAGLRGEYLLFSIGATTEHLQKLGQGRPLASSAAFAPVRRDFKPGLISLVYADANLTTSGKAPIDKWIAKLKELLGSAPPGYLPEGLAPRLKKDARSLLEDLNRWLPEATPVVSMSFLNQGIESFTYSAGGGSGLDTTRPLTILSRAGASPLVAIAARAAPSHEAYERFAHWVKVAYGYFEDYAVPRIPRSELKEFERFQRLFIPILKDLHETTANLLLPALEGCQNLLVIDAGGRLSALPAEGVSLPRPLRYPRPLLAIEVNDPEKLTQAFRKYRESLNRFFRLAESELKFPSLVIPPPASSPHAGGTLYAYQVPPILGPDFKPHALVSRKLAVLALGIDQSKAVVESTTRLAARVVDLAAESGMVYRVDLAALSKLVLEGTRTIFEKLGKERALSPQVVAVVQVHLRDLERALGALKSFTGRIYTEEGLEVHHSWLHIEDLAND